jgi:hypothetical protein
MANAWIEAIHRKTIKNMSHTEFISKYSDAKQCINDLVLILCGNRFHEKLHFVIKIFGALHEPFAGPHFVQIGNQPPFWVHSLTAFRREFFGLTDKLSFERSVFVCLSNGEVVRLKIARPYLFVHHRAQITSGDKILIRKSPTESFLVTSRDIEKHREEIEEKRALALQSCQAVRTRIRNHLVTSVQHLFCSYMRDHQISPQIAKEWFHTDVQFAISQCDSLFGCMIRVNDPITQNTVQNSPREHVMATTDVFADALMSLHENATPIDLESTRVQRQLQEAIQEDLDNLDLMNAETPITHGGSPRSCDVLL